MKRRLNTEYIKSIYLSYLTHKFHFQKTKNFKKMKKQFLIPISFLLFVLTCTAKNVNPFPRQIIKKTLVKKFDFDKLYDSWDDDINCSSKIKNGNLTIVSTNADPQVILKNVSYQAPLQIVFRAKSKALGTAQFFWATPDSPMPSSDKMINVPTLSDGKWHTYSKIIPAIEKINFLRLDPFGAQGEMKIDFMEIYKIEYHPLEIISVAKKNDLVEAVVTNHTNKKINFSCEEKKYKIAPLNKIKITQVIDTNIPFEQITFKIVPDANIPTLIRPVNIINLNAETNWINLESGQLRLKIMPDGSGAKVFYKDKLTAAIFPLAKFKNNILKFKIVALSSNKIKLISKKIKSFTIEIEENFINYKLNANKKITAPVIRIFSDIEQALLPGVEYLGKNEKSSTDLDLKIPEHIRFKPDKMWITMPLIAFVTPNFSLALEWINMNLQPYFAVPDFFDGQANAYSALEGKNIRAKIKFNDGWNNKFTLENFIELFVKSYGLPSLPKPPRSPKKQFDLCMKGIESVRGSNGWGHCADDHFPKLYYADYASLIWRATGKIEKIPDLIPGGGHLPSPEVFFITGRADKWLKIRINQAKEIIKSQKPDGSFICDNKFREGHFENTASGFCAIPAENLLRTAYFTGDKKALAAGLKTLDYISRFRTPRGSQTWEIPLHTPDILASARLTKSYIYAYKLTGEKKYLTAARKWALTGVPFVYLYGNQPIMKYATIAVLGATGWIAPNWIGLPVQWCGLVYADAVLDLAEYDKTFDWKKLAKGIYICGEQMQYTSGKTIGTLPDSFTLKTQTRNIYDIGPLMLMQFQRRFAGKPTGIYVARDGKNVITAPFPVKIKNGKAVINAKKGLDYQIIINRKIKNIKSKGKDVIELKF